MILYPTETVYGLGVNALDRNALALLYALKGRDAAKSVSWLVRDVKDIERYAYMGAVAQRIAAEFLPGPLTLVLPLREEVAARNVTQAETIGFRVSGDEVAQKLIVEFMTAHDAPLTATSANISGMPTLSTPDAILAQFGDCAEMIVRVIDDGPRTGLLSTVVRVVGDEVEIIREGVISAERLAKVMGR